MRSGTSFFDRTVFKKTICRFWPLWGLYTVIWLIPLPLNGLMRLRMDAIAYPGITYGYIKNFAEETVPYIAARGFSLTMAVIFGVLCAMAVFSHLYNARSANLFGSLPIRREGLFLTHCLAGLCFLIVPNVFIFLLTLLVEAAGGAVIWQGLLFWLAVTCGECFFFYSMAVFCAMFTGHILVLPAFYAIFNGIVAGMTALVEGVLSMFYYGFAGFPEGVGQAMRWFTPVWKLGVSVRSDTYWAQDTGTDSVLTDGQRILETEGLDVVGIYAVVAAALVVGAFFLYRVRRLESAGDVVSVNRMKPVFKYGVAFCAGLLFGMSTTAVIGGGEIALIIAIAVWGVIGYFTAEMLLQKSFRVFKKWKGAAVVAAAFIALFCVVNFDLTGFETRIPDPSDVDSVFVSGVGAVYLGDNGDHIALDISDPDTVALLNVLHRAAVDQRDLDDPYSYRRSVGLHLEYTLKNGSTLTRSYSLNLDPNDVRREGTAAWAVQQIYNDRDLFWRVYGFDQLEDCLAQGMRLGEVSYGYYDVVNGYNGAGFSGQDGQRLLAAVKEDFFAGRIGVRDLADEDSWYSGHNRGSLEFHAVDPRGNYKGYVTIVIQDTASGTLAALKDMADRAGINETGYYE